MHRLRYHPDRPGAAAPQTPSNATTEGPARAARDRRPARAGAGRNMVFPLAVAVVALLAGGAYAATTYPGSETATTADLAALARRAVLTPSDLPAGWTADPPSAEDGPDDGDRALAECLGTPYDDSPNAAEASFSSPEGFSVTSEFSLAPSLEWARADFATLLDDQAPGCFEKVMGSMLNTEKIDGATFDIGVSRFDVASLVPPAIAGDATGLRATIALKRPGLTLPMTFDAIMIRHDRIEATVAFNSVGDTAFPEDLRRTLTAAVVNRLAG